MKKVMLYTLCILSLAACQKDDELGSIDPGVGPAVHHLAVDENNNTLYIYGENFRNQKGSVTVGDVAVNDISNWSDKVIQCIIKEDGAGSRGTVKVVPHGSSLAGQLLLQEWNVVVNFERPQGGLGNAIKEEVDFNVRIRGNAKPYPSTVTPLLQESKLNATSYAIAKVHGSGTTTVPCSNPEGGGTYFVDWGSINTPVSSRVGLTTGNYNSANTHFDGIVKLNEAGKFILKLKFEKVDINNYEYKYTDCSNNHSVTPKKHRITFDYFEYEDIPLIVEANKIKADVMVSPTGHPSSIGLQRDNTVNIGNGTDYTVNGLAKITMSWSDTPGKF